MSTHYLLKMCCSQEIIDIKNNLLVLSVIQRAINCIESSKLNRIQRYEAYIVCLVHSVDLLTASKILPSYTFRLWELSMLRYVF